MSRAPSAPADRSSRPGAHAVMDSRPHALLVKAASTMSLHTTVCALLLAALSFGCSKQGEGERCDLNSGNLDCDTGLICRSGEQLSIGAGTGFALCCPPDGVAPSVNACSAGAQLPDDLDAPAAPAPVDAGPDAG